MKEYKSNKPIKMKEYKSINMTIIDAQNEIKKMINTLSSRKSFIVFPILFIPRLILKDTNNYPILIIGLILCLIAIFYFQFLNKKRIKILKSIFLNHEMIDEANDEKIDETINLLKTFKKYHQLHFIWAPIFFIGFSMVMWDIINTDTITYRFLFIGTVGLIALMIILPIVLIMKNPVDRLLEKINKLGQ